MSMTEKFELNENNLVEEINRQIFNAHKIVLSHGQSLHFPFSSTIYFKPRVLLLSHEAYIATLRHTVQYQDFTEYRGLIVAINSDRHDQSLWGWVL